MKKNKSRYFSEKIGLREPRHLEKPFPPKNGIPLSYHASVSPPRKCYAYSSTRSVSTPKYTITKCARTYIPCPQCWPLHILPWYTDRCCYDPRYNATCLPYGVVIVGVVCYINNIRHFPQASCLYPTSPKHTQGFLHQLLFTAKVIWVKTCKKNMTLQS